MIKLLVVDDEQIERDALQVILEKHFPNVEIKQARNGRQAVEMASEFQPHLILMDIQMPGMNGFEAIERINERDPSIKFIMITAYATFDYAHSALKLGVIDYMVKPTKVADIVDTMDKALHQVKEQQKLKDMDKEQQKTLQKAKSIFETDVVTQLLFDHVHEVHLHELVEMLKMQMTEEKFVISVLLPSGSEKYYSAIREKARSMGNAWIGALYGRQLPIIVFKNDGQSYRSQAILMAKEILKLVKTEDSSGWFIGIGNIYHSLEDIKRSYQESLLATRDTSLPVKYRFYSDVPALSPGLDQHSAKRYEHTFFTSIRNGEWDDIVIIMIDLIESQEKEGTCILQSQQRLMELIWILSQVMSEIGVDIDSHIYSFRAADYRQLRAETRLILERMHQNTQEHQDKLEENTIGQIKQYIIDHAYQDISLEEIGKVIGLSPIYISKIFKEQLGVNYIHFLTDCRIEKAKRLMRDPEKSLKQITFEVGYHDPNYFSKVFKKMCHISPTEYRKSLLESNKLV
ncbi:response regulator [Bacillus salacetis]|uniref:Response regulator n=1 Tax=Bacillus salacetis TaxID=2315464 RepID=A0A3A1R990_9BACI|nr:response regulator [Bacillus salacetis]RIW38344.1 response regulator [Bacillus salacetis]